MAKFEKITEFQNIEFDMPQRKTFGSAGYDFAIAQDIVIPSYFSNFLTLILEKFKDEELQNNVIKDIEKLQTNKDFIIALANKDSKEISKQFSPILEKDIYPKFNLDLTEVKRIVKESQTRMTLVPTGVKCKLAQDEVLQLYIRSSCALNNYLMLPNSVGIIDSDYYNNQENEGHIFFQVINLSPFSISLKKGDIIGQGIITKFIRTEDDIVTEIRKGGFGSTNG